MEDYDSPERVFPLAREDCDLSVPCSVSSVLTCTCILEHLILKPLYPTNLVVCVFSWSWVGNINWWYYVSSQFWVNQGRTIIILRGWRLGNFHRHKIFSHLKAKNNFLSGRQYKNLFNMKKKKIMAVESTRLCFAMSSLAWLVTVQELIFGNAQKY